MTKIKPLSSMSTPRYADISTFFRLPIVKDLSKLDYCFCGVPWDGGTTNSQVQDMALERLEMPHH